MKYWRIMGDLMLFWRKKYGLEWTGLVCLYWTLNSRLLVEKTSGIGTAKYVQTCSRKRTPLRKGVIWFHIGRHLKPLTQTHFRNGEPLAKLLPLGPQTCSFDLTYTYCLTPPVSGVRKVSLFKGKEPS